MERKIFVENALDMLAAAAMGRLEDGDGKRNESIANSACPSLPETVMQSASRQLVEVCKEQLKKTHAALESELLSDAKKETVKMLEVVEKAGKAGEIKDELTSLSSCGESSIAQTAAGVLAKLA